MPPRESDFKGTADRNLPEIIYKTNENVVYDTDRTKHIMLEQPLELDTLWYLIHCRITMSIDPSERTPLQHPSNEARTINDETDQIEKACLEYEGMNSPLIGRHSSSNFSLLYDVEKSLYEREDLETTPNWNQEFRKLISLFYPVVYVKL